MSSHLKQWRAIEAAIPSIKLLILTAVLKTVLMFLYLNQGQLQSFFFDSFVFLPTDSQSHWDNLECEAEKKQWEKSWEHWCGTTYTSSYQCDSTIVMAPLCSPALEQRWSWIRCWEAQLHKQKPAKLSATIMWQSHITTALYFQLFFVSCFYSPILCPVPQSCWLFYLFHRDSLMSSDVPQ